MDHGPSFRSFHGAEPLASLPPSAIDPMFLDFPAVTRWLLPPASLHDLPGRQPSHLASTSVTMRALQLPGAPDSERITVCTKRTPALAPILHLVAAMLECRRHTNVMQFLGLVHLPQEAAFLFVYESLRMDLLDVLAQEVCARELLELAVQAARGLATCHEQGLAHGDVKPDNLMLSTAGVVKLCDFGLVRPLKWPADGEFQGTLVYAAPELFPVPPGSDLARGSRSPAADVWAFGCTLYALFARELPYAGEGRSAGGAVPAPAPTPTPAPRTTASVAPAAGAALEAKSAGPRMAPTVTHRRGRAVCEEVALQQWGARLRSGMRPALHRLLLQQQPLRAPQGLVDLISDCLQAQPTARPTMVQVEERLLALRPALPLPGLPMPHVLRVLFAGAYEAGLVRQCCQSLVQAAAAATAAAAAARRRPPLLPQPAVGGTNAALLGSLLQQHAADAGTCASLLQALQALTPLMAASTAERQLSATKLVPRVVQALALHKAQAEVCMCAASSLRTLSAACPLCAEACVGCGLLGVAEEAARVHAGNDGVLQSLTGALAAAQARRGGCCGR